MFTFNCFQRIVELLLAHGANIGLKTVKGETALSRAWYIFACISCHTITSYFFHCTLLYPTYSMHDHSTDVAEMLLNHSSMIHSHSGTGSFKSFFGEEFLVAGFKAELGEKRARHRMSEKVIVDCGDFYHNLQNMQKKLVNLTRSSLPPFLS